MTEQEKITILRASLTETLEYLTDALTGPIMQRAGVRWPYRSVQTILIQRAKIALERTLA